MPFRNEVRRLRRELGLSQSEVARAAGLSRQLVTSIETGRHVPGVGAALALAAALGASVEELFGVQTAAWEPVFGVEPDDGTAVVAARVGDRNVFAPSPGTSSPGPFWSAADGVYRRGTVELLEGVAPSGFAVAGCDPALGLASSLLERAGPRRPLALPATSRAARRALEHGRLHAALVHGPGAVAAPAGTSARKLARWRVGLAGAPGRRVGLDQIAQGGTAVAMLGAGAEATSALERALERDSASISGGPVASGHLEAAHLVAHGAADVAVIMEPAAQAAGLAFTALEEHDVWLLVDESAAGLPGAAALVDAFESRALRTHLGLFVGYELVG